jgi:hypothetical protein
MLRAKISDWAVLILVALVASVSSVMAQEQGEEKPWKGTVWIPLSYEIGSTSKTTYEIGMPYFFAAGGGTFLSVGVQMNMYKEPLTLLPQKGTTFTFFGATAAFAKGGGVSATLIGLHVGIGYRYQFSKNFHGRIGIGPVFFIGNAERVGFSAFTFVPVGSLGFSF